MRSMILEDISLGLLDPYICQLNIRQECECLQQRFFVGITPVF